MCNFSSNSLNILIWRWQQFWSLETECWKMGCVTSKNDINDLHPNLFEVVNVDGMCNPKKPGQMEVCETDLVWYERSKPPVVWPLKHLRRYGHDGDLFSFECGRRCPSGPGIYAFKTTRAAQLFKLVQDQTRNNVAEDGLPNTLEFSARQQAAESNYLEPAPVQLRQNGVVNRLSGHHSRLNSVASSSGPLSPITTSPSPPPPPPMPPLPPLSSPQLPPDTQHLAHDYSNATSLAGESSRVATYANIDLTPTSVESELLPVDSDQELLEEPPSTPVYMNVALGQDTIVPATFLLSDPPPRPVFVEDPDDLEERHSYANLDVGEIEMLKGKDRYSAKFQFVSLPSTPPPQQINYIQLDLDQSCSQVVNQPTSPVTPTEPIDKPAEGYATIDFNRTVALCAVSCERSMLEEEGCRKTRHDSFIGEENHRSEREVRRTRHNSTISELMAPITSRLSTSFSE